MRTKVSGPALVVAALFAFATPAYAQWSNNKTGASKSVARTHRHKAPRPDTNAWGAVGATHSSRQDDCPNGDCRGVNSPGNLGGSHGDF
jgi:hypothetical protein